MDTAAVPKPAEISNNVKFVLYDVIHAGFSYTAGILVLSFSQSKLFKTNKKTNQPNKKILHSLSIYTFLQ